jgi:hypothetical protein
MLTGLRGVGKTVLLNEFAERASNADWMTIQLEVRPKSEAVVLTALAARISSEIRRKAGGRLSDLSRRALRSVKALSMTIDPTGAVTASIDIDATPSGDIEVDLAALAVDAGTAARELGTGVAVFVDELQDLDKAAMASLAAAAHAAGQRSVPFLIVGAGLPNLPGRFAEAKSYSERLFDYRMLDKLSGAGQPRHRVLSSAMGASYQHRARISPRDGCRRRRVRSYPRRRQPHE